jgi:hypothetical protein
MNKEEQIAWYWNHISDLSKEHSVICTCHLCIQLVEKGYIKIQNQWLKRI